MERKQLVEKSRQSFTRLARFINQLMREQLFCGPVTVQQCYTLEALIDIDECAGSRSGSPPEYVNPYSREIGKTKSVNPKAKGK
jgi:hypothetical protein